MSLARKRPLAEVTEQLRLAGRSPIAATFLTRAVRGLVHIMEGISEKTLGDAAGAASDYEVLIRAMEEPEATDALREDRSDLLARLRGLRDRERLLQAEGGVIPVEEAARLLRVTRQAVDKRRRAGRLIGLPIGRRGYAYPVWQFGREGVLRGIERILLALRRHDPWMQAIFLLNPNTQLDGRSPLEALRSGEVSSAERAAVAFGEHGSV